MWSKSQDKNLNILRTKRAFKIKWKAFFIIFKGLSVAKKLSRTSEPNFNTKKDYFIFSYFTSLSLFTSLFLTLKKDFINFLQKKCYITFLRLLKFLILKKDYITFLRLIKFLILEKDFISFLRLLEFFRIAILWNTDEQRLLNDAYQSKTEWKRSCLVSY